MPEHKKREEYAEIPDFRALRAVWGKPEGSP